MALDSLVAGTPIVTTNYPYHAPEFDYLADGMTAVVTPNDEHSYADGLVAFLTDRPRQQEMSKRCRSKRRNTRSTIWFGVSSPGSDQHLARRSAPFDGPKRLL